MTQAALTQAAERLRTAQRVFVITGAGVSAESGVATFRGADGHWRRHRAEDLASPEGFARDPALVWEWYNERRRKLIGVLPNPAHHALAALERQVPHFLLATQNVDGLHQAAGSRKIETLHGDIWSTRCLQCDDQRTEPDRLFDTLPPACEECGGMLRPAIVWFGEYLPPEPIAHIEAFLTAGSPVDIALVVGTTALIGYVQTWALGLRDAGATLAEINPEQTLLSAHADIVLWGPAGRILPQLLEEAGLRPG